MTLAALGHRDRQNAERAPGTGRYPTISLRHLAIPLGRVGVIGQEAVRAFRLYRHETADRNMGQ